MNNMIKSPILLIGGLAMKADEHSSLAECLRSKIGRRTIYFDNINVGAGPRIENAKELTIFDQAQHQWNKINETVGTEVSISIYGISMGGMIASTMATMYPKRVESLVLAATSANLAHNPSVPDHLFETWTKAKHEDDIRTSTRIAFGNSTLTCAPEVYENYFQYRIKGLNQQKSKEFIQQLISVRNFDGKSIYKELNNLTMRTTVLTGKEDVLFNCKHKSDIKSLLSHANFCEIEKTGHMLHLENLSQLSQILFDVFNNTIKQKDLEAHET